MPANKKVTELDAITSLSSDDLVPVVDSPGGTPVTKKITFANLLASVSALAAITSLVLIGTFQRPDQASNGVEYVDQNKYSTTTRDFVYTASSSKPILTVPNIVTGDSTSTNSTTTRRFSAETICLTGDTCRTTWPTGGGAGTGNYFTTSSNNLTIQPIQANAGIFATSGTFNNVTSTNIGATNVIATTLRATGNVFGSDLVFSSQLRDSASGLSVSTVGITTNATGYDIRSNTNGGIQIGTDSASAFTPVTSGGSDSVGLLNIGALYAPFRHGFFAGMVSSTVYRVGLGGLMPTINNLSNLGSPTTSLANIYASGTVVGVDAIFSKGVTSSRLELTNIPAAATGLNPLCLNGTTVQVGAAGVCPVSALADKQNLREMRYGLKELMQIDFQDFELKNDPTRTRSGPIADWIEKTMPEYMIRDPKTGNLTGLDLNSLASVYGHSIQEQQKEIESLQQNHGRDWFGLIAATLFGALLGGLMSRENKRS